MAMEYIGAFVAGLALFGVMLAVNRLLLRGRLGRWVYPAAAATGMLAFTLWAEYSWPARAVAMQPGLRIASVNSVTVPWRPWSLIWPQTNRIVAISTALTHTHPQQPALVLTQLVLLARYQSAQVLPMVFDCEQALGAALVDGVVLNPDGSLEGVVWSQMEAEDPVLRTACTAMEEESNGRGSGS